MVLFGYLTVHSDQAYLIKSHTGECSVTHGPTRQLLFRSQALELERFSAAQNEYLDVQTVDGERRVVPGPVSM